MLTLKVNFDRSLWETGNVTDVLSKECYKNVLTNGKEYKKAILTTVCDS